VNDSTAITLIVAEPGAVARRLAEGFGWEVTADHGAFAEVAAGVGLRLWLHVPSETTSVLSQGIVLHWAVDDVPAAADRARRSGAEIVREPARMDFGLESALVQVAGGPMVDLTKPLD
jgi:predicted enzyme related to lactoylglutathione lyase